ncbi:MAG TPA: 4-(cytidine 5'-diphospho)-2-C-methyl-D-erythritol kinase, partial [Stellaceae bacterium]|nr:4-(cytidine 5'-diphospho)-2-C-methyl-D-erythritol kinase [Stellaceae bacterium]
MRSAALRFSAQHRTVGRKSAAHSADVAAFAPAKVNLYLHILGRRSDGYHELDSLVAFADIGDRLLAAPAAQLSLALDGPEAASLAGLGEDNLVLRAARRLAAHAGVSAGAALRLEKNLPAAAGIGGGSSDAVAALKALAALWRVPADKAALAALGRELGADVPVCLYGRPAWVGGIGERITPAPGLPPAGIVLANPRIALPTAAVFAALGLPRGVGRREALGQAGRFAPMPADAQELAHALALCRNDLTEAAVALVPEIGAALARLAALPGALLARMSGSGATCFALFADRDAALRA